LGSAFIWLEWWWLTIQQMLADAKKYQVANVQE
jgi:hypothetical protein